MNKIIQWPKAVFNYNSDTDIHQFREETFLLITDASTFAISAVLSQRPVARDLPIVLLNQIVNYWKGTSRNSLGGRLLQTLSIW